MTLRVVWPPHVDYLRAVGPGEPSEYGFVERAGRWWKPGWWAQRLVTKGGQVLTCADAEAAARVWPQPMSERMHLTRVDIACDVTGGRAPDGRFAPVTFTADHRLLFTGRGRRTLEEVKDEARTLNIGSRVSPLFLRVYLKSASNNLKERDKQVWREHGWDGRSDVWRIEYELKRRALAPFDAEMELPAAVPSLWADCIARVRMCSTSPRTYAEQNKAPTHPWWVALGTPQRRTRRGRSELTLPSQEEDELHRRLCLRQLEKLANRAGVALLPVLAARLRRIAQVSGAKEQANHEQERQGASPGAHGGAQLATAMDVGPRRAGVADERGSHHPGQTAARVRVPRGRPG